MDLLTLLLTPTLAVTQKAFLPRPGFLAPAGCGRQANSLDMSMYRCTPGGNFRLSYIVRPLYRIACSTLTRPLAVTTIRWLVGCRPHKFSKFSAVDWQIHLYR